jgi:hypothetical protein
MRSTVLLVFAAVACGGTPPTTLKSPEPSGEGGDRLEAEFGGPSGLMEFFDSTPDAAILSTLNTREIGFARDDAALTDCTPTFAEGETWHAFDGEFYYVEAHGRPNRAYKYLPPIAEAPRVEACQGNVGRWGDEEDAENDYDGGHMIGSQLGGYGGRVNLVPQDLNFNRGNWLQIENEAANCGALPDERIFYGVRAEYGADTSLVPTTMSLTLESRDTGESVSFEFENDDGGGPDGTAKRTQAIEFLAAHGCE